MIIHNADDLFQIIHIEHNDHQQLILNNALSQFIDLSGDSTDINCQWGYKCLEQSAAQKIKIQDCEMLCQTVKVESEDVSRFYDENEIKHFKESLQLKYGARLSRTKPEKKYLLLCRNKGCEFAFEFVQFSPIKYRLIRSNTEHTCGSFLEHDEMVFLMNRKKVIDLREDLYNIMKSRFENYKFQSPKVLLTILANSYGESSDEFLYGGIELMDDQRKIKKKFDNLVAEIKVQLSREDENIKQSLQAEKKKSRRSKWCKRRLTLVEDESPEQITLSLSRRSRRRSIIYEDQSTVLATKQYRRHSPVQRLISEEPLQTGINVQGSIITQPFNTQATQKQQQGNEVNDNSPSSSTKTEFEVKANPNEPNLLMIRKDYIRRDGSRVTDKSEWDNINRIREQRDLKTNNYEMDLEDNQN